jgi:two-component system chemotaxis response regulator CheB
MGDAMHSIIAIGGSFGAMQVLLKILAALPEDFPGTLLVVTHIGARKSSLAEILHKVSRLPVRDARDGDALDAGLVLLAPADQHMLVSEDGRAVRLYHGPKENHTRPAIDPLFRSVAVGCGARAIGVILTGYLDDGVAGLQAIKSLGGIAIVQHPADAAAASMPSLALESVAVDHVLPADRIGPELARLASAAPLPVEEAIMSSKPEPGKDQLATEAALKLENQMSAGDAGMQELARIATPSTFTCPECHGTLWRLGDGGVTRYRCHTGHAFTARILQKMQCDEVEDALWGAVRALQERERMLDDLLVGDVLTEQAGPSHAEQRSAVRRQIELLRQMLTLPAV